MKRRAVFLFTAAIIMLCTHAALANTVCQSLKGTWMFNYGGSDNRTVYVFEVNDFDTNGGIKNSVFTCWAYAVDANGKEIQFGGAITEGQNPYAPTTLGYYETYSPNASTPYDRINLTNFTGSYFDNVTKPLEGAAGTCSFYGGPATCYWLDSGLTFGRKIDNSTLIPGKCGDWLGRWAFTYFNLATTGNLSDNTTDNVTITNVCDDNNTCVKAITDNATDNSTWSCIATGRRLSDNTTMFIGKVVGDPYYRYYNYDNYTQIVANAGIFGQINDTSFFTTQFTADLSALDNTSKNTEPTNLISGARITTTTTSAPVGGGTCPDWVGTWTLSYDNSTDTLPGDNNGNGRNGDYEVKICKYTANYVFPSAPTMTFPCFAEGKRTVDGKLIYFIASPFDPVTAYRTYYYELDAYPSGALSNGALINPENFAPTAFTPSANTFGLTAGVKTSNDTTGCETTPTCAQTLKVFPPVVFKILAFAQPFSFYVIIADRNSGIEFSRPISIDWGTDAINDLTHIKLGKRLIFGVGFVRPLKLVRDDFVFTVTYGDNDTEACGTLKIR
jgi:hypothetical protein